MRYRRTTAALVALLAVTGVAGVGTILAQPVAAQDADITFEIEGDELAVAQAADQTVRGQTTLDPGTELDVRVRGTADAPFLLSDTATVAEDGSFAATFDFSGVEAGAEFTVTVRADGGDVAETDGVVVNETGMDAAAETETDAGAVTETTEPERADSPGQPGFGGAAALVALVATVALARRRR